MLHEMYEEDWLFVSPFVFDAGRCHVMLHEYCACLSMTEGEGHILGQLLIEALAEKKDVTVGPWTIELWAEDEDQDECNNDDENTSGKMDSQEEKPAVYIAFCEHSEHRMEWSEAFDVAEDYAQNYLEDALLSKMDHERLEELFGQLLHK